jgi:hypothetical protein
MFFPADFGQIDPDAPSGTGDDYRAYMIPMSPAGSTPRLHDDLIIDLLEQKKEDGPVFLYAASMENHSAYSQDKYGHYDYPFASALGAEARRCALCRHPGRC